MKRVLGLHNSILLLALITFTAIFMNSKCMCNTVYAYDEVVIVIDPGHGGQVGNDDDDANAGAKYNNLYEKDVNLTTARALKDELEQYGNVVVYLTRDDDRALTLDERVNYAVSVNADFIISVHYNASADHNFFGSEIFTSAFGECYAKGHAVAECIMNEWVSYGNTKKDIKTRMGNSGNDYYGLIRHATENNIPAIILEHSYLDNDKDFSRIGDDRAFRQMGILDARGIANYYGLYKDTYRADITPTVNVDVPMYPVMPDETAPYGVSLEVLSYDFDKGDIEYKLYAYDDESKLMYYGFELEDADKISVFKKLEKWDGNNGMMTGHFKIKQGYEGPITAGVFNVYQLDAKSNTIMLKGPKEEVIEETKLEKNSSDSKDSKSSTTDKTKSKDEDTVSESHSLSDDKDKESTVKAKKTDKTDDEEDSASEDTDEDEDDFEQVEEVLDDSEDDIAPYTESDVEEIEENNSESESFEIGGEAEVAGAALEGNKEESLVNSSYANLLVIMVIIAIIITMIVVAVVYYMSKQNREDDY